MIRYTVLWLIIVWLCMISWKDWYKGVCGLILLMAILEIPDMPRSILGIQGLNPWNILLIITICSWMLHKSQENLNWDMPKGLNLLLFLQFLILTFGVLRMFFDSVGMEELRSLQPLTTYTGLWNNYYLNSIKWVIPGLLLFHGCNSRPRLMMALVSLLAMYLILSILVFKAIPPWKIIDVDSLTKYAIKLDNRVGYHRVDLSAMLAGASWAMFSAINLARQNWQRAGLFLASGMVLLGQALTGGRAGYMAWFMLGLVFGLFRWRKILLLIPMIVFLFLTFIPQIRDRALVGFASTEETGYYESGQELDVKTLTAGRDGIWHLALNKFWEAPFIGHGRLALLRTGVTREAIDELGEGFGHPHNAYIEQLLDNGIPGLLIILLFYLSLVSKSFSLLRDTTYPLYVTVGGVALALIMAQLITSLTAQSFYPRQGVVGMWCAIGLMLRVYVEREKARQADKTILIWDNP